MVAIRDLRNVQGGHERPQWCVTSNSVTMKDLWDVWYEVAWLQRTLKMCDILSLTWRCLQYLNASNAIDMEMFAFSASYKDYFWKWRCLHFPNASFSIIIDIELFAVSECFCYPWRWRCWRFPNASFSKIMGIEVFACFESFQGLTMVVEMYAFT